MGLTFLSPGIRRDDEKSINLENEQHILVLMVLLFFQNKLSIFYHLRITQSHYPAESR
jgi:hypothetical protein